MKLITRSRQRGQTLIIIFLGVLLLGGANHAFNHTPGGSIKELRSKIKDTVQDPQRKEALMAQLDGWEKERKAHDDAYGKLVKDVLAGFENPAGTQADFEHLFQQADQLNTETERIFLDSHDALRGQLSDEEWRKVFPPPGTAKEQ